MNKAKKQPKVNPKVQILKQYTDLIRGVDEDVISALEDKGATQSRLLDALKARIEKAKKE